MKQRPALLPVLAATLLCAAGAQAHDPDPVAACERLNQDYVYYRDRGDAENYAKLFTSDGEFVMGATTRGRDAIAKAMTERFEKATTRHFVSTVRITPTGETTAAGLVYVMVFGAPRSESAAPPVVKGFMALAEYHDGYVLEDDECRFARRELKIVYRGGE